jgi:hypothetical protein
VNEPFAMHHRPLGEGRRGAKTAAEHDAPWWRLIPSNQTPIGDLLGVCGKVSTTACSVPEGEQDHLLRTRRPAECAILCSPAHRS